MPDPNDDRLRAMLFQSPRRIPVSAWALPAAWMRHRDALREIAASFPEVFPQATNSDYDAVQGTYIEGTHVDAWGCVWENVCTGMEAIVTRHPLPEREDVRRLKAPAEDAGTPHGFMYLRLADLRGFEELMLDFAEEPPELQVLLDVVRDYNIRQVGLQLERLHAEGRRGEILWFGDDLGMQTSLPMGPEKWRRHLKPCFDAIYRPIREAGHYVYMHTDGHILEIIPDLIDVGVSVLNPQFRANGLAGLRDVAKGLVCLDQDLDRQMLPFASPAQIAEHIHEIVETLGAPEGGLWLKAEFAPDVPLANVVAVCEGLMKYRDWFARVRA